MPQPSRSGSPPIDRCPFCEDDGKDVRGRYDSRIMLGGRGIWRCPESREHTWQDADEQPHFSGKDFVIRP